MSLHTSDINMPVAKALGLGTATVAANAGVTEQAVQAAAAGASFNTWVFITTIPWDLIGKITAATYGLLLLGEWWWKKFWRPLAESRGWLAKKKHRIISVEEYDADASDAAPLGKN